MADETATLVGAPETGTSASNGQVTLSVPPSTIHSSGQGTEATTQGTMDATTYLKSLPPEQQRLVEPILKEWQAGYTRTREKETQELKQVKQFADAFNTLKSDQRFLKWYYDTVREEQAQLQNKTSKQEVQTPQDMTDEEISDAFMNADPKRIRAIIEQQAAKIATGESQKLQQQRYQDNLEHQMEALARDNPEFNKLDAATDEGLAPYMYYYVDVKGKSPMDAFIAGKQFWDAAVKEARTQIMAETQNQKRLVTESPSTLTSQSGAILVDGKEDPLDIAMREALQGRHTEVRRKR